MNHKRIVADPTLCSLLLFGILYINIISFFSFCFLFNPQSYYTKNNMIPKGAIITIIVINVALNTICVIISPKFLRYYIFHDNGIMGGSFLRRKKRFYSYEEYKIIVCAEYFHGSPIGIGKNRYYIVISNRSLSRYEQDHIINCKNQKDFIMIKYSSKNCDRIRLSLPQQMQKAYDTAIRTIRVR